MEIIIVGAGFGGMSAGALLSRDGHEVTILEKNEQPGGRGSYFEDKGYYFDMGPSWYLMSELYDNFFQEFDKKAEDFFNLEKLDPSYRIFLDKKRVWDISANLEENYQLFDGFEENGGEKLKKYLQSSKELYEFSLEEMLYRDYNSILDLLNGKLLFKGYKLRLWENLQHFIDRQFESEEARKILQYAIGFLGGSPENAPSFYHLVSHSDLNLGVWYPQGGMRKVTQGIYELALSQGVNFHFQEEVELLEVHEDRVKRVISNEGFYEADVVVVNADYAHSELDLLKPPYQSYDEKYWESRTISPSALVAYLGIDSRVENLAHHNLFLNKDWDSGFEAVFNPDKKAWSEDSSYYVNVPSLTDDSAAPEGGETIYILAPLAPGLEDSDTLREKFLNQILDDLEEKIDFNIQDKVVVKKIFALNDFKTRYNAYKGTAFGLSHTMDQTALWRPAHKSKKVENLYYTGQYNHPGIGVPMTLVSSQILSQEIR
ncbi:phytoene desaturase [Methanobacterium alkalithermotolerans]|uniref:Phytoene desaturase n=1 Tax=Methanobacterium alkalithermotolerans TaxID=2731220 RepID=A0A8T8K6L8_9EURY|nr:phytoene desaturase family protein [Methanobacterium alkalithermotolerans]QUH22670.1 phytoene desaturase [Methanobacterium alkalithermotolerans]